MAMVMTKTSFALTSQFMTEHDFCYSYSPSSYSLADLGVKLLPILSDHPLLISIGMLSVFSVKERKEGKESIVV